MALTVKFYSVSKAVNSTALPTGEPMAEYECRMLDACSILRPVILLNVGPQANPTGANYAYIAEYNRYYWVADWTVNRGQWAATLTIDPLASWKTEIGNTYQYVLRSASASNGYVQDTMYPALSKCTIQTVPVDANPFANTLVGGEYVVGIVGKSGTGMGAVNYYVMTPAQFLAFGQKLYGDTSIYDIAAEEIATFKAQFNPLQYIVYCQWFPFTLPKGAARSTVDFGWWELSCQCNNIPASPVFGKVATFSIPNHPQSARGLYLNKSPYSRYILHFGPFGDIPLDSAYFPDGDGRGFNANMSVDMVTGQGILRITTGGGYAAIVRGKVGVDISLAQISVDYKGAAVSAVESIGTAIATGGASLLAGGLSGISNAIDSTIPQVRSSGSNGSLADFVYLPQLECQFFEIAAEDNDRLGRPLCARRKINTLSGYLQTVDTELQIPATSGEIDMIKSYMEGGMHFD